MGRGRDLRILLLALLGGAPGALLSLFLLWRHVPSAAQRWTGAALVLGALFGFAFLVQSTVVLPLQRLANLLAAIREGDYSLRAVRTPAEESFGAALQEASALSELLRGQRFESLEAAAFLGAVMAEVEVAVFAFDGQEPGARLKLANRAGAQLLGEGEAQLLGRTAQQLGLERALACEVPTLLELPLPGPGGEALPGQASRWEARTRAFHQGGVPHRVLVLSDLRRALREEERLAWQRLIRVLSHEINNSLTPIQSIAQSLKTLVGRGRQAELGSEEREDLREGLQVIGGRAEAVGRFMAAYAQLARLPAPRPKPLELGPWLAKAALLEQRVPVTVAPGPAVTVLADQDQLEQLVINLLRNAAEACLARAAQPGAGPRPSVEVGVRLAGAMVELWVADEGPGLPPHKSLFVPFFTTKPSGSGIGLILSRQIAEAHGGELLLRDRKPGPGAEALLRLPRA
jgi:two-component system, NtrC family, nitrogen regulation sensor histidine kinase NtrY